MPPAPKKAKSESRPVEYTELHADIKIGDGAITIDDAKFMLGWTEETEESKFGSDYIIEDYHGNKIRCSNNITNRPVYTGVVDNLKQEHLRKRWVFNGEPIIIGKTGLILNGQHTLLSLILAEQERAEKPKDYGKVPITLSKLVVFGVDESDTTVNTMDTCKPRSLADVIYRAPYFAKMKGADRKNASRITDYAIRFLWYRTGVSTDAYAIRRTHSEAIDFLTRHPKLLECVKHVMEENSENRIGKWVSAGTAAGLLYMMGSSKTDTQAAAVYREKRKEKDLNWDSYDKACEFWVLLAAGDQFLPVRNAIGDLTKADGSGGGSALERTSILIKAWNEFASGTASPKGEFLRLKYNIGEDGVHKLIEIPSLSGIDLGDPSASVEAEDADITPEQIEANKAEIDAMKAATVPVGAAKIKPPMDLLKMFKDDNPDKTVVFKQGEVYHLFGEDASLVAQRCKRTVKLPVATFKIELTSEEFEKAWVEFLGTDKYCGIVVQHEHGEIKVIKKWKGK